MNLIRILKKPVVPIRSVNEQSLSYWRERIFFILSLGSLYIGTIVYAVSIYFAIESDLVYVFILDTIIYLIAVAIFTMRIISFKWRVNLFLVIIYLLGIGLLVTLGKSGAGIPWLFALPVLAGILMSKRGSVIALLVNALSMFGLFFLMGVNLPDNLLISEYGKEEFVVTATNFLGLNTIITISLLIFIEGLNKSLKREKSVIQTLKKEKRRMAGLKEKAEESEQLKTAFLANISHEIRTPLNAIMGFTDLMSKPGIASDDMKIYSEIINTKGEVLLNLINDLIDISMIESKQLKIREKEVEPGKIMEQLYLSGKQLLKKHDKEHLELKYSPADKERSAFHTDPLRLQQILSNLLHNSIKYTHTGMVEIGYDYRDKQQEVLFFVKDTGVGIPEEKKAYIFRHFTQLENDSGVTEGTGLGLAISRSLVEMMGGQIDFQSDSSGTTFYFTLPFNTVSQ